MAYELPHYVRAARIATPEMRYEWDDTRPRRAYGTGSEYLITELAPLTPRAKIAAAIAVYEWILGRFAPFLDDARPFMFAEAAWAANVSMEYLDYVELDREEWRGPIRGPLWSAVTILSEMMLLYDEDKEPALRVAQLTNLALHVLPTADAFREWLAFAVARLKELYTVPAEDPFEGLFQQDRGGPLVPREAVDPTVEFSPATAPELVERYLSGVDYVGNYFLQRSEEALEGETDA
jgi:hypothetical protein